MTLSPVVWEKLRLFSRPYMKLCLSSHHPDGLGVKSGLYEVISAVFSGLKWMDLELLASSSADFSKS